MGKDSVDPDAAHDALDGTFILQGGHRKVTRTGVSLTIDGFRGKYWSPELALHFQETVAVRYRPDDLGRTLIYSINPEKLVCKAQLIGNKDPNNAGVGNQVNSTSTN